MVCLIPYDYKEASGVIHKIECLLFGIIVTPDGINASYVDIHDGEGTADPKAMRIRCSATVSEVKNFLIPIKMNRGLYVSFGANLESVTVLSGIGER